MRKAAVSGVSFVASQVESCKAPQVTKLKLRLIYRCDGRVVVARVVVLVVGSGSGCGSGGTGSTGVQVALVALDVLV